MKNEERPDDSGRPWNSSDLVFGGISCSDLSRLCNCFVSALRMTNGEGLVNGVKGKMMVIRNLIDQQIALSEHPSLTDEERKFVEGNLLVGLQSVCLAGVFASSQIDARHLVGVGVSTIQIINKLSETTGPVGTDDEVVIRIRKGTEEYGSEAIEMGIGLEPSTLMAEESEQDNLGKQIKDVINPPDLGPLDQGLN